MEGKVFVTVISLFLGLYCSESSHWKSSSYTCQAGGSVSPVDVSKKTLVAKQPCESRIACGVLCLNHHACVHFQYDAKLGVCIMYSNVASCQSGEHSELRTCSVQIETIQEKVSVVFLRRINGSVDFYRTYEEYKNGFGDSEGEFWLGLDCLHQITNSGQYKLLVNLTDWSGARLWAVYNNFSVAGEADGYRLTVGDYDPSSTAGDSLTYNHDQRFTTWDRDQDEWDVNCAASRKGGWWYRYCSWTNPTGLYKQAGYVGGDGVNWYHSYRDYRSLKAVEMTLQQE